MVAIIAILAGLLLLSDMIRDRIIGPLLPFEAVIGVVALVAGLLNLLSALGITLVLAGLVLAIGPLSSIPSIGPPLARAGRSLAAFRGVLGIIVLILGVAALF
jgi:hypothetical protein